MGTSRSTKTSYSPSNNLHSTAEKANILIEREVRICIFNSKPFLAKGQLHSVVSYVFLRQK